MRFEQDREESTHSTTNKRDMSPNIANHIGGRANRAQNLTRSSQKTTTTPFGSLDVEAFPDYRADIISALIILLIRHVQELRRSRKC